MLLGVKSVIAESFERIHRSNLVGMGVLPLQFVDGESAETHGLTGFEKFGIKGISEGLEPRKVVTVAIMKFIPQKPEKPGPGTPGVRGVIGNFLSQRAYMPTGGCVPDPKDYSSSNPHVPSSTTVYGPGP